jgi:hypothetical protein
MTATITVEPDRDTAWDDRPVRDVARRRPSARPASTAVRVLPVPRSEPPSDDELDAAGISAPPMEALLLPLDLATGAQVRRNRSRDLSRGGHGAGGPTGTPEIPESGRRPGAARVGGRRAISDDDPDVVWALDAGEKPETAAALIADDAAAASGAAELRHATRLFLATCAEVVGGYRPLAQLRPLCQADRFDAIVNRLLRPSGCALGRGHAATRTSVVAGHGGPPRAGRTAQTGPGDRVAIRRVQVCDVIDGIAEIAVVMARRDKVWAMALRLEQMGGRWLCTHLEVV